MRTSSSLRLASALWLSLLLSDAALHAKDRITPQEAARHAGQTKTVCGKVVSAHHATDSRGQPTFLNLDKAYPEQIFTIVIWKEARSKFARPPEEIFFNKKICVTGEITLRAGKAQIEVDRPTQIEPSPPPADRLSRISLMVGIAVGIVALISAIFGASSKIRRLYQRRKRTRPPKDQPQKAEVGSS